jgi:hypothetical protein
MIFSMIVGRRALPDRASLKPSVAAQPEHSGTANRPGQALIRKADATGKKGGHGAGQQ